MKSHGVRVREHAEGAVDQPREWEGPDPWGPDAKANPDELEIWVY